MANDNIYPDQSAGPHDIKYAQLLILASDARRQLGGTGSDTIPGGGTGPTDPGTGTDSGTGCGPCNCRFFDFITTFSLPDSLSGTWSSGPLESPDAIADLSLLTEISFSKYITYATDPGYADWLAAGMKPGAQITLGLSSDPTVYAIYIITAVTESADYFTVDLSLVYATGSHTLAAGEEFILCWDNLPVDVPVVIEPPPCFRFIDLKPTGTNNVSYIDCDGNLVVGVTIGLMESFCAEQITSPSCHAIVNVGPCELCDEDCCVPVVNSVTVS